MGIRLCGFCGLRRGILGLSSTRDCWCPYSTIGVRETGENRLLFRLNISYKLLEFIKSSSPISSYKKRLVSFIFFMYVNVYLLCPRYLPPSQQELNCYHQESFVSACFVLDSNVKTEQAYEKFKIKGRISSVGRALDCRAGGRGFNSRDRTNTQRLKITEK